VGRSLGKLREDIDNRTGRDTGGPARSLAGTDGLGGASRPHPAAGFFAVLVGGDFSEVAAVFAAEQPYAAVPFRVPFPQKTE